MADDKSSILTLLEELETLDTAYVDLDRKEAVLKNAFLELQQQALHMERALEVAQGSSTVVAPEPTTNAAALARLEAALFAESSSSSDSEGSNAGESMQTQGILDQLNAAMEDTSKIESQQEQHSDDDT